MSEPTLIEQLGAVPMPTFGGKQIWGDVFLYGGWRIQKNAVTDHHRLLDPNDIRLAAGSWRHCHNNFSRQRSQRGIALQSDHLVLLLHGYFRSKDSFGPLTKALGREGYEAHAVNYPSTRQSLQDHASQIATLLDRAEGIRTVSFVCHSMGGIVARVLLAQKHPWRDRIKVNRLLMIATPNGGAEMAAHIDQLGDIAETVVGPSMRQLHPMRASELPIPDVNFGIIAGARGNGEGYNPLLPGDDDMTVSVESTRLKGAEDMLVVNAMHTFIMIQPQVIEATKRYLETGRFL